MGTWTFPPSSGGLCGRKGIYARFFGARANGDDFFAAGVNGAHYFWLGGTGGGFPDENETYADIFAENPLGEGDLLCPPSDPCRLLGLMGDLLRDRSLLLLPLRERLRE